MPAPLDDAGQWFWLTTRCELNDLIIRSSKVMDYQGRCPQCRQHRWKGCFFPMRFRREDWKGDDFVITRELRVSLLCSKRAADFLMKLDKQTSINEPVYLE